MKYLSVRERALRAVEDQLRTITIANGYNTNVRKVQRARELPDNHTSPPQIYIFVGKNVPSYRGDHQIMDRIELEVVFATVKTTNPDMEYNSFLCDIDRILQSCDLIVDTTYPVEPKPRIYTEKKEDMPIYTITREGNVVGRATYGIEYWFYLGDPRLWDNTNDKLVQA